MADTSIHLRLFRLINRKKKKKLWEKLFRNSYPQPYGKVYLNIFRALRDVFRCLFVYRHFVFISIRHWMLRWCFFTFIFNKRHKNKTKGKRLLVGPEGTFCFLFFPFFVIVVHSMLLEGLKGELHDRENFSRDSEGWKSIIENLLACFLIPWNFNVAIYVLLGWNSSQKFIFCCFHGCK
jgi:hypothetical protein